MPENNKGGWFTLTGLALLTGVGLAGWGLYELVQWQQGQDEIKQELINEYILELHNLDEFQAAIAASGREPTDFENQMIDRKTQDMAFKEWAIKEHSTTWFEELVTTIERLGSSTLPILAGIVFIPIAGFLIYQIVRWLFKRRPPKPPSWRDPLTGVPAGTPEALKRDIKSHAATTDPSAIAAAQAVYEAQPFWTQEMIASEARVYGKAKQNWSTLHGNELIMLAYGMAFALGLWLVAPMVGPAAALLLI